MTKRAEQYYSRLMGRASTAEADMRQDWTLVQELEVVEHVAREERQRRLEKDRQRKNQEELQEQLEKRNLIAAQCREVWRQWGAELEEDAQEYRREEERKRQHK